MKNRFYIVMCTIARPILRLVFPTEVKGVENLPDSGVVLCANHVSGWDPILICLALPRLFPLRIMAKMELMNIPILGWLLKKVGVFGVDRGHSDAGAIRTSIKTIREGGNLLVFPEGTRVRFRTQVRAKGGVVMIAMRTGAQLVPVYVDEKLRAFRTSRIVFGTPYYPSGSAQRLKGTAEEYQEYADEVLRRAYELGDAQ